MNNKIIASNILDLDWYSSSFEPTALGRQDIAKINMLKISPGDNVLYLYPKSITPIIHCATKMANVDVIYKQLVTEGTNNVQSLEEAIRREEKLMFDKFGISLIGNRINPAKYIGSLESVVYFPEKYSHIFLGPIKMSINFVNNKNMLSKLLSLAKEKSIIIISSQDDNLLFTALDKALLIRDFCEFMHYSYEINKPNAALDEDYLIKIFKN